MRSNTLEDTAHEYEGATQYGSLKQSVAKEVKTFLINFQQKLNAVDESALLSKLEASEEAMRQQASATLLKVQQVVGLRPL